MCRQDFLFEKTSIIFQTSWIIGVFGVCNWISQTRNVFWTVHSPACLSYKSLLFSIAYRTSQILLSHLFFWLYSKRMQHHKLIHKINNLMFSDRRLFFYQIPMKQDYLWSCCLGELSFSSSKLLEIFLPYTLNTPATLYGRRERATCIWVSTHILSWLLN